MLFFKTVEVFTGLDPLGSPRMDAGDSLCGCTDVIQSDTDCRLQLVRLMVGVNIMLIAGIVYLTSIVCFVILTF
jgi:hypothetical protein